MEIGPRKPFGWFYLPGRNGKIWEKPVSTIDMGGFHHIKVPTTLQENGSLLEGVGTCSLPGRDPWRWKKASRSWSERGAFFLSSQSPF
jgi:hypothetical protein